MATWATLIEHYSSSLDDLTTVDETIAEAIIKAVDRVQIDLLLKYADVPSVVTADGINAEEMRVLYVERDGQPCNQRSVAELYQITDNRSMHYATKYTPVFVVQPIADSSSPVEMAATLKIYPAPVEADSEDLDGQPGAAYLFTYPTVSETASTSEPSTITHLPPSLVPIIVLYAAEKILAAKLALMVHEEEDGELSSVIQNQLSTVRAFIVEEEPRLGIGQLAAPSNQGGIS
tara:strand:+ start:545 stop:1243 length:699 start_codon:yes stop_codon:yes gene_type:complete